MLLIVKGKADRAQCSGCDRLCEVRTRRERRGVWCLACRAKSLAEIVSDYRRQVEAGVPSGRRWVMVPLGIGLFDETFDRSLRDAISAIDREPKRRRRLVAV
jgi:hypothetical protein